MSEIGSNFERWDALRGKDDTDERKVNRTMLWMRAAVLLMLTECKSQRCARCNRYFACRQWPATRKCCSLRDPARERERARRNKKSTMEGKDDEKRPGTWQEPKHVRVGHISRASVRGQQRARPPTPARPSKGAGKDVKTWRGEMERREAAKE